MENQDIYDIEIEIDKLTNSFANRISGESFQTEITKVRKNEFSNVTKKNI